MKYLFKTLTFAGVLVAVAACNKREIIPAPEPVVDLKNHFYGKINSSEVELTQNVNGYVGSSDLDLIVNSNTLDSAIYLSTMSSPSANQLVKVGHGSLLFDWGASERPTLASFESFFLAAPNLQPSFSTRGLNGFCFIYVDASGKEWKSNQNHSYLDENVTYLSTSKESDTSGDYMKFKVEFETFIYHTYYHLIDSVYYTDSMLVTDAVYTGWYKR